MTKQGVRDLNDLGPKKQRLRADYTPRSQRGGDIARVAEPPVADAAPVVVLPPA
jgi:hypothetical protein